MKKIGPLKIVVTIAISIVLCCSLMLAGIYWSISGPIIPRLDPTLASPNKFTQALAPISPNNAPLLEEIQALGVNNSEKQIISLHLNTSEDVIQAIYLEDARMRLWKAGESRPLKEFDLIKVLDEKSVSFDDADLFVLNSTQMSKIDNGFGGIETRYGNNELKRVSDASLVRCYCGGIGYKGAILHPSGQWILAYDSMGVSVEKTDDSQDVLVGRFIISVPDDFWWISSIAFDSRGEFLAVAFEEGHVRIYSFQNGSIKVGYKVEVGEPTKTRLIPVKKVVFDSSRNWLATLRGDMVSVWKLQEGGKLHWQSNIPTANEIAFDRMGKMMFIGTNNALEIWNLETKSLIMKYQTSGVSAILVTPDGRLLIWAGKDGAVHIWGIRAP